MCLTMTPTPTPSLTSAETLGSYPPGHELTKSRGPAWRDVQTAVFSLASDEESFDMPAVNEPFIVWIVAGEAETRERELGGAWVTPRIRPGSLYLTSAKPATARAGWSPAVGSAPA